jgi:hypothetical protein
MMFRKPALGFNYNATPTTDVIVRYNKIHDFGACDGFDHGVYTGVSNNGQIYGNWIYNGGCSYTTINGGDTTKGCGSGIQVYSNSNNFSIHSNVIDGTGVGLFLSNTNNDVYNNGRRFRTLERELIQPTVSFCLHRPLNSFSI